MTIPKEETTTSLPFIKRVRSKLANLAQFALGLTFLVIIFILCQWLAQSLKLNIPPALLGIGVLLMLLLLVRRVPRFVASGAKPLLSHMVLFLIPAIVGIVAHVTLILEFPFVLLLAIVGTTIVSLFITALLSQKLMGKHE